jgi:pilus assembly protein CpaF
MMSSPFHEELEKLMNDVRIEDILLSPAGIAYVREGRWQAPLFNQAASKIELPFLNQLARMIAESAGMSLGLAHPSVDAYLQDGQGRVFRAHVVIAPMVDRGPVITLRRLPTPGRVKLEDFESLDPNLHEELRIAILEGLPLLIAGATGSGKTTLMSSLLSLLAPNTRVLILEDSPELPLPTPLSTKLLTRHDRFGFREGALWDLSHLVFESLRMRPDRLVLGECRNTEALAVATALRTGHSGLMTSIHAGSCLEALDRFSELVARAGDRDLAHESRRLWKRVVHVRVDAQGKRVLAELIRTDHERR